MKFAYTAKKQTGETLSGVKEAPDVFTLSKLLRTEGLVPLSVEALQEHKTLSFNIPFLNSVKLAEKIIFTRNLAAMISAGLSLYRALGILQKQTKNPKFKSILVDLSAVIDKGGTLSEGMAKYPKVFSTLFVSMVRAGEESGSLPAVLSEVGVHLDKSYKLNKKIKGALMYPSIIIGAIIIIGILMFMFVVPTLTKTFKELNVELPKTTQFIVWLSDVISAHPILVFGLLLVCIGVGFFLARSKRMKPVMDIISIRLPVVGTIVKEVNTARTARTLASLLKSGVFMSRSLEITRDVLQNTHYKAVVSQALLSVEKGAPLSETFKSAQKLYPVMMGEMIEVGEETGKLSEMLLDIAVFYEDEVENKTKDLSTIIEPVLMIFIGVSVGFFAVSMLTPMYSILDGIN